MLLRTVRREGILFLLSPCYKSGGHFRPLAYNYGITATQPNTVIVIIKRTTPMTAALSLRITRSRESISDRWYSIKAFCLPITVSCMAIRSVFTLSNAFNEAICKRWRESIWEYLDNCSDRLLRCNTQITACRFIESHWVNPITGDTKKKSNIV